jgi:hypothetical protein
MEIVNQSDDSIISIPSVTNKRDISCEHPSVHYSSIPNSYHSTKKSGLKELLRRRNWPNPFVQGR